MNYKNFTLRFSALGVLLAAGTAANAMIPNLVVTTSGYFDGNSSMTTLGPLSFTGTTVTEPANSTFTLGSSAAGENLGTFTLTNTAHNFSVPASTFTLVLTYTSPVSSSIDFTSTVVGKVFGKTSNNPASVEVIFANHYSLLDLPPTISSGPYTFGVGVQSDIGFGLNKGQTTAQSFIPGVGTYTATPAPAGVLTFAIGLLGRRRRKA